MSPTVQPGPLTPARARDCEHVQRYVDQVTRKLRREVPEGCTVVVGGCALHTATLRVKLWRGRVFASIDLHTAQAAELRPEDWRDVIFVALERRLDRETSGR